ncbi:glycoside hydrolase family 3 protein [Clostridium sp. MSJ-11]|uniref:beta-glucosidase n=1 Tax=Clostridium mobile TaxID=2841512 RepID=A0ABS6EGB3_9CLOT|nr:glycoside hydrolase family 3 N-terminal domain-containing protein [Clostridium mobile]MBU5484260.1 glycoside hydrolase family 3 protein [Clostridium mobile]
MKEYTRKEIDNYIYVKNHGGKDIAYAKSSGVEILEEDGYYFKDLNKNGKLDPYEDWRLPIEDRINDLVNQMSIEQIAGLMLYSQHQAVSTGEGLFARMFSGTYDGKSLKESGKKISDLTDQQKKFLTEDNLRHILLTVVDDAKTAAKWNNNIQAFVEGMDLGIPNNISSDPRHTPNADTEFNAGSGGKISKWPEPLGLAATFDPELVRRFGQVASKEYRCLGISTALSPQVDIATEPRWMRFSGTFGDDSKLSADMAEAYCDGFQTDEETGQWGAESVNAMVKHWPGGGSGEGGRDAHFGYGKFAVYPGNNFEEHLIPFTEGAFKLKNGTKQASAVMPYYTISYDVDIINNENVGNSYSKYLITDLLRNKYKYDGVVCTDWMITKDCPDIASFMVGKCWGVETMSEAQRHYKILMAGVDQFGGNNEMQPIIDAYEIGIKEHGETFMRERFERSAKRLLKNIFSTGLFENPYVDPDYSETLVGNKEFMQEGYDAQVKSVVMLKNKDNVLPICNKKKVYIPKRRVKEGVDWFGNVIPAHEVFPVKDTTVERYYTLVETPEEADFALVFIESPDSVGYKEKEGYVPITLQYRPYTAEFGRKESIAQDKNDVIKNRSYLGKSNTCSNEQDLDIILETKAAMKDKPVIVSMNCKNPTVVEEFESKVQGILINFNVQLEAILDIVSGKEEPSGLLPFQMPKDMKTVEEQFEDVSHDMECYVDEEGHSYDFAYGMNYSGVIQDDRVKKYKK